MLIRNVLLLIMIILAGLVTIVGQEKSGGQVKTDEQANPSPEEMEYWKRQYELTQKAEGVEIAITPLSNRTDANSNSLTEHYLKGSKIQFKVSITNTSTEALVMSYVNKYAHHHPRLFRNGQLVPYSKRAAEAITEVDRLALFNSNPRALNPSEPISEIMELNDWYDPLEPGAYQLRDSFRLILDGRWIKSPVISFEVWAK